MDLAAKLQLKPGQGFECVRVPDALAADLTGLTGSTAKKKAGHDDHPKALIVFAADCSVLEKQRAKIVKAASADRLTWVAYPKAGQLGTDLNRDTLASLLEESGIQPVRQIAIDDVWSALRFRPG
jgi:hypothetical protein